MLLSSSFRSVLTCSILYLSWFLMLQLISLFITGSVSLRKMKPTATELSQTYDPVAVGRKKILPNCWQLTRIQHWLEWVLDFLHTQSLKNTGQSQIWSLRSFHEHSFQNIFALQKTFHKHDQVEYTPILLQATSLKETLSLCRSIRRNRQKSFKWATVLQDLKPLRDFYYFKTWNTKVGL